MCWKKQNKKPLLVGLDVYRPAAIDQLITLGKSIDVEVYYDKESKDVVDIASRALSYAREKGFDLVIFDTEVVDLSGYIDEPVETLMSIQLGGGTNITKALTYCEGLIENPHRTIVILVSDLYEGYDYKRMYGRVKSIIESGAKLIVLTALNMEAEAVYDDGAGVFAVRLRDKPIEALNPWVPSKPYFRPYCQSCSSAE